MLAGAASRRPPAARPRAAAYPPTRAETKTCADIESQRLVYAKYSSRIAAIAAALNYTRRLWCPLIAVPASQLHLFSGNIVKVATDNLFLNTFVRGDNYHFYGYLYGEYTRECCPRYLKAENFAKLRSAVANIDIRTGLLQDVAATYPDGYFSRYILLDHMDWMPMRLVLDEWAVFVRKARADVRFLWRSFSDVQHIAPGLLCAGDGGEDPQLAAALRSRASGNPLRRPYAAPTPPSCPRPCRPRPAPP